MKNWSTEENEAMRGYILLAAKLQQSAEGKGAITDSELKSLLFYLYRATDEMTAEQAAEFYRKNKF